MSPFVEVLPTSVPLVMDDSLNHHFWPFPPNVTFRNHEVGRKGWATRLWHPSGLPGCSVGNLPHEERQLSRDVQFYTCGFEL